MRKCFTRLGIERLERRDNPSGWGDFWSGVGDIGGAFLEGLGEGASNIAIGAQNAVVELVNVGGDLVTIYSDWDGFDPTQLDSQLFQGAVQTANDENAAAQFDDQLIYGIATLGVGPLVESGYNAVVTGDSTEFSQQAGGFGVMVLVPYAGVEALNALPRIPINLPVPSPTGLAVAGDGVLAVLPSSVAWVEVAAVTLAVPAETSTAITVLAMSSTGGGGGGTSGQNSPSNFGEVVEQAVQDEWTQRGDVTADAMTLVELEGPHVVANPEVPGQVRYQAQFVNEFTGETIDVSVNYDPTTGQFGTIKPASGK